MRCMVDDNILAEDLKKIISEVIEADPEEVTLTAKFVEDLGMDSMMALEILAAIEKKYGIQIPESNLANLTDLQEAIKVTKEYLID
ncbi:MAG: acyl carrier protein [Candidatus Omnitrophica bacterium]|nr:acyl carrier protein [Candidatus Omnitrophota bacterium]MDD5487923.1 acyl carrier protein [Candidatus Omnitrophota bacterium]